MSMYYLDEKQCPFQSLTNPNKDIRSCCLRDDPNLFTYKYNKDQQSVVN